MNRPAGRTRERVALASRLDGCAEGGRAPAPEDRRELAQLLDDQAPALSGLLLGDAALLDEVLSRPLGRALSPAQIQAPFAATVGDPAQRDDPAVRRALRRQRHRAMVRIALRELLLVADVDQTGAELSVVASAAVEAALVAATRAEVTRHGRALDALGQEVPQVVLGMGKLGGSELNLGSDIDLCFFYGSDDGTVEGTDLSVHELFAKIAARTVQILAEVTEDGFCFRVDLRLRPEGTRGPLVNSLVSAERYYETWGRSWERAALLRASPIAGDLGFGRKLLAALRPFVYRRAVEPRLAVEMGKMLERSRRELRVDEERDIKLGRGGIREAEFFVQTLQLVWGGRHPELQVSGTIEALKRLVAQALVSDREAAELEAAWALLRRVEHRIHMTAGFQTHRLPESGPDREAFAASLGFADGAALLAAIGQARDAVHALFASLDAGAVTIPGLEELADLVTGGADTAAIADLAIRELSVVDADEAAAHLMRLARGALSPLGAVMREREPDLGTLLLAEIRAAADPDQALRYVSEFFARLGGPWPYGRMLAREPRLLRRLVGLFGTSTTLATAFLGHPEAIDQRLATRGAPPPDAIRKAHEDLIARLTSEPSSAAATPGVVTAGGGHEVASQIEPGAERAAASDSIFDPEAFVSELRRLKRESTLEVGLAFVGGDIDARGVEERLTTLAEAQVRVALAWATLLVTRGRPVGQRPRLAIVGLGKLGGRELGFGGDLDLMFLFAEPAADASTRDVATPEQTQDAPTLEESQALCTRIAQRTMALLAQPDAEGPGYQTDARLRPSGNRGMLVVSLTGFERYHQGKAQAWERQILVRARPIAGDPTLGAHVADLCAAIAYEHGTVPAAELAAMRARLEQELGQERPGRYHPKLGYGALVDVEFAVQSLQMSHGDDHRVRNSNTLEAIDQLERCEILDSGDAAVLRNGHTFFRSVEQALRLLDEGREPVLLIGGRTAERVARRLGMRDRDGHDRGEVLTRTWRREATSVRRVFERLVGAVGTRPPWHDGAPETVP